MCRLFGQISEDIRGADDFLVRRKFSLLRQSFLHPKAKQRDGWGLAWRVGGRWSLVKSRNAVFEEKKRFSDLARAAQGSVFVAHIRHASNPRKLPKSRLIGLANSQPFVHNDLAFAHNGTLNIPDAVARGLGKYRPLIRGENDSEVLFWLFVKEWEAAPGDWQRVFARMAKTIEATWKRLPKSKRKHPAPSSGLNFVASDGKTLAAHCRYDRPDGKSLCGQGRPYFEMCYNKLDNRIVAASEPMDSGGAWKPIPRGRLMLARPDGSLTLAKLY